MLLTLTYAVTFTQMGLFGPLNVIGREIDVLVGSGENCKRVGVLVSRTVNVVPE